MWRFATSVYECDDVRTSQFIPKQSARCIVLRAEVTPPFQQTSARTMSAAPRTMYSAME
jgi:hypothetical protein